MKISPDFAARTAIAILSVLSGFAANAAPTDVDSSQQIINASKRTIAEVIRAFRPVLRPRSAVVLLDPQRILVIPTADFNAYSDYTNKRVLIPAEFMAETLLQMQGTLLVEEKPSLRNRYVAWLKYLTERSQHILQTATRGGVVTDHSPLIPFWKFANQPPQYISPHFKHVIANAMVDAAALVVGHELGHLVLGHRQYTEISSETSQRQEYEADAFAEDLVSRAGLTIVPGLAFYERFIISESSSSGGAAYGHTHPSAECRVYRMVKRNLERMTSVEHGREYVERIGENVEAQLQSLVDSLRDECAQ